MLLVDAVTELSCLLWSAWPKADILLSFTLYSGVVAPSRFAFLDTPLPGSRLIVQTPRCAVKPVANLLGISVVRSTWIPTDTSVDCLLASALIN